MSSLKNGASLQDGKYIISSTLGQGGFGITYEAEQVSLGRKVAVKEFFMKDICNRDEATSHVSVPSVGSKELVSKFKDKFIREARMIAGLDHEHIVKIHDVFEENGTAYYVMEYLGGGCLGDVVKAGKAMPEREAVESIRQIASALKYLHNKGIIHFDVKPSNVLKTEDGKLKLIDFGISKHYDETGVQTSSTPVGISKGYAPLEQYQQGSDIKSFTPATDIYSLGATLFALLVGSNPPEASVIYEDGLPIIEGVSPVVMCAIEKAMQPRRKDRPQSVEAFIALLDGTAKEDDSEETVIPVSAVKGQKSEKAGTPAQKPVKPQKSGEKKSKGFPKWLYGLIAGVAVAALAAVLLSRPDKTDAPDNLQTDSTSVVSEAVPQKPVTSQPSESASKPETPSKSEATAKPEVPSVIELKSIILSKTTLELEEGSTATLTVKYNPSNATDKTTTWKSSNSSVAKVSTNGKVTAQKAGSTAIIANCQGKDAYCNVTVKSKEVQPLKPEQAATQSVQSAPATTGTHAGHEWVDLGLSVKWATCNVGASSPSDYGGYYAWGETETKSRYDVSNCFDCLYCEGNNMLWGTYKINSQTCITPTSGHDTARENWGGSWRMPTHTEIEELCEKCKWAWTSKNGHNGFTAIGPNGNSIFLPAAGYLFGTSSLGIGGSGHYRSSTLSNLQSHYAYDLYLYHNEHRTANQHLRSYGKSVRPVCP